MGIGLRTIEHDHRHAHDCLALGDVGGEAHSIEQIVPAAYPRVLTEYLSAVRWATVCVIKDGHRWNRSFWAFLAVAAARMIGLGTSHPIRSSH
ncbi:hypothetical protein [Dyella subtropica]|uniref:hypothetical protein n=1 Tax=Dyella subtropica TaxID=2992127 RepID=UPI0022510728|nr:hypothetical protein [Dyella subtropica]